MRVPPDLHAAPPRTLEVRLVGRAAGLWGRPSASPTCAWTIWHERSAPEARSTVQGRCRRRRERAAHTPPVLPPHRHTGVHARAHPAVCAGICGAAQPHRRAVGGAAGRARLPAGAAAARLQRCGSGASRSAAGVPPRLLVSKGSGGCHADGSWFGAAQALVGDGAAVVLRGAVPLSLLNWAAAISAQPATLCTRVHCRGTCAQPLCRSLGCLDAQCVLCEHNPHRRCSVNFSPKYLVNDVLKASMLCNVACIRLLGSCLH